MHELTLKWIELGEVRIQTIWDRQPSKNPGSVRIGRDPTRCDIVLLHPTVSGLHVEIFYDSDKNHFYLRSLRPTNPPKMDGEKLHEGEAVLRKGSIIGLGKVKLKVIAIDPLPSTKILSTLPAAANSNDLRTSQIRSSLRAKRSPLPIYGLQCSNCTKISPSKLLDFGCPWCGTCLTEAKRIVVANH